MFIGKDYVNWIVRDVYNANQSDEVKNQRYKQLANTNRKTAIEGNAY